MAEGIPMNHILRMQLVLFAVLHEQNDLIIPYQNCDSPPKITN